MFPKTDYGFGFGCRSRFDGAVIAAPSFAVAEAECKPEFSLPC
jgi:hypothetical protein